MPLNQIYCVSWISVTLSVTLLYKNRKSVYIVIVHLCYRTSTIVFHDKKLKQFSLCLYLFKVYSSIVLLLFSFCIYA